LVTTNEAERQALIALGTSPVKLQPPGS
jgi:hypothetical protein